MKQQVDIRILAEQLGLHLPDPDYLRTRIDTAKTPKEKEAWTALFNYYKGAMNDD